MKDMATSIHIEGILLNNVNTMYYRAVSLLKRYREEVDNMRKFNERIDTIPPGTIEDKIKWIATMEAENARQGTALKQLIKEVSEANGEILTLYRDLAQELTRKVNKYQTVAAYADTLSYFFYALGSLLALSAAWYEAQEQSTK